LSQITFNDLFAEELLVDTNKHEVTPLEADIKALIEAGETSAIEICEKLIESGKIPNERFSTNKPKSYGKVCSILENFVTQGELIFIEDREKKDRIYQLKR
jgi:hypothetical protein